ncbi:MAG: alpha/beta hydrolase [Anaerolineales bacterium]
MAEWLNQRGIAAFVLHYRLIETPEDEQLFWEYTASAASKEDIFRRMDPHAPVALEDALQAIRIVRGHAEEWGLKPDRIGMMGFSAGGHLAVNAALSQKPDCKLDFIAPIYGIWWHKLHIPKDAPSFFTACASNDPIAAGSCVRLYQAWQAAERPAELHLYAAGDHGFGMVKQGLPVDGWIDRLYEWMVQQSLV